MKTLLLFITLGLFSATSYAQFECVVNNNPAGDKVYLRDTGFYEWGYQAVFAASLIPVEGAFVDFLHVENIRKSNYEELLGVQTVNDYVVLIDDYTYFSSKWSKNGTKLHAREAKGKLSRKSGQDHLKGALDLTIIRKTKAPLFKKRTKTEYKYSFKLDCTPISQDEFKRVYNELLFPKVNE